MPPVVAAAAITGAAALGGQVVSSRAASGASRRSIAATNAAAARAEAFEREQEALNRADQERRDAEDKRRWEVEQANVARIQEQNDQRLAYEDAIRYGKMVNLARLTGQPAPPPPPRLGGGSIASLTMPSAARQASAPIMSRPSTAAAMIPAATDFPTSPLSEPQRMPISQLVGRRRVI